jgi:uncharacterized RDD family membrane protein YckC
MIDGLIQVPVVVFLMLATGEFSSIIETGETTGYPDSILWTLAGLVAFCLVNGYLLATQGQTVGKKIMGVRIVAIDGSLASLGRVIFIRTVVTQLIYIIPSAGLLFAMIDVVFIFRQDHRCIHDLMAGTKVVTVA